MDTDVSPSVFVPYVTVLMTAKKSVSAYNQEHRNPVDK